jgi:signal transduction histidine kinase
MLLRFERERNESILTCADYILAGAVAELTAPLRSLASLATLLERERSPRRLKAHVLGLSSEVAGLQNMLNQLAEIAVLRLSQMRLQPVNVQEMVSEVASHLRPQAPFNSLTVRADPSAHQVVADPVHLRLVFTKLLSEALSVSPPGAEVNTEISDGGGLVKIKIVGGTGSELRETEAGDTHPLHADSDISFLCNQSLDLAVAAALVHVHGGAMKVHSANGPGVCFSLTMPAYAPARRKQRVENPDS